MLFQTNRGKATLSLKKGEQVHGINILERLQSLMPESVEAEELFHQAASVHQRTQVPRVGFSLEDPSAVMPTKKVIDVGYDISAVAVAKRVTEMTTLYESHVKVHIPFGYYVEMVPRSSLSKTGYMLANNVGIIDPGYTGTIKIPLIKIDQSMPNLELPARVCQLILKPYVVSESYDASDDHELETSRGDGGFGSTG